MLYVYIYTDIHVCTRGSFAQRMKIKALYVIVNATNAELKRVACLNRIFGGYNSINDTRPADICVARLMHASDLSPAYEWQSHVWRASFIHVT